MKTTYIHLILRTLALIFSVTFMCEAASADNLFINSSLEDQNPVVTDTRLPYLLNKQTTASKQIPWMVFENSQLSGDGITWTGGLGSKYRDQVLPYTSIAGWTFINAGEWDSSRSWTAQDGEMSMDLNCMQGGGVFQTVKTIVGQEYTVGFYLSGNPYGGAPTTTSTIRKMELVVGTGTPDGGTPGVAGTVKFNGTKDPIFSSTHIFDTAVITGPAPYKNMRWAYIEDTFVAVETSTTVFFHSLTADTSVGAVIDNMSIVPEPVSMILLATGGVMILRRKFARMN